MAVDKAFKHKGLKIMLLLRMTPIMPFSIFNYALGATSVSLSHFAIGGVGSVPEMIILIYFGTAISNVKQAAAGEFEKGTIFFAMMIIGTIIGIIAIFYISYIAKQELNEIMSEQQILLQNDSESTPSRIENIDSTHQLQ